MPDFSEYTQYDAVGLAELIRNGDVTQEEVLEAALERMSTANAVTVESPLSSACTSSFQNLAWAIPRLNQS